MTKDKKPRQNLEAINLTELAEKPSELWTKQECEAFDNAQGVHVFNYMPRLKGRQMRGGKIEQV